MRRQSYRGLYMYIHTQIMDTIEHATQHRPAEHGCKKSHQPNKGKRLHSRLDSQPEAYKAADFHALMPSALYIACLVHTHSRQSPSERHAPPSLFNNRTPSDPGPWLDGKALQSTHRTHRQRSRPPRSPFSQAPFFLCTRRINLQLTVPLARSRTGWPVCVRDQYPETSADRERKRTPTRFGRGRYAMRSIADTSARTCKKTELSFLCALADNVHMACVRSSTKLH